MSRRLWRFRAVVSRNSGDWSPMLKGVFGGRLPSLYQSQSSRRARRSPNLRVFSIFQFFFLVFYHYFTGFPSRVPTWLAGGPSGLGHVLGRSSKTPPNPKGSFLPVFYRFFAGF